LAILYFLRAYNPIRLENVHTRMEIFIDKVIHWNYTISIIGILLTLLGKNGEKLLIIGIVSTIIFLIFMAYNKIKFESKYVWGQKYFLRIIFIIGLTLYLFLKGKGLITF